MEYEEAEALEALTAQPSVSLDVVYAHAVYMGFPEEEIDRLLAGVFRALRPGGRHLFAVRSTSDRRFAAGREVAPDVRLREPGEPPLRYYRRETLARFLGGGFERVEAESPPGVDLWYVADRRP